MTITKVDLKVLTKTLVLKISTSTGGLQEQTIWLPVAPGIEDIPLAPAPTVNANPVPPESAPVPLGFNYESPNLHEIFDNILVETNDAVYAEELEPEFIYPPYSEIIKYYGLLRTYVNFFRYKYSVKPRTSDAPVSVKIRATGVRLYKFKCEKGSFSVTGIDAIIYPTRILVAAKGEFSLTLKDAGIKPLKVFADKGAFVSSFSDAQIRVPGTFSYGWSSSVGTLIGDPSPIGIGYRRNIHQSLYTKDILLANGARAGAVFKRLRWYVTTAINPNYSILGMNIRLFHSTALNASLMLVPKTGETKTVVYSDAATVEFTKAETVGVLQIDFLTNFEWDGVNSIVVESCTSQNQTNYDSQGGLRRISDGSSAVRRHSWTDASGSSCSDTPNSTYTDQISIQMDFS